MLFTPKQTHLSSQSLGGVLAGWLQHRTSIEAGLTPSPRKQSSSFLTTVPSSSLCSHHSLTSAAAPLVAWRHQSLQELSLALADRPGETLPRLAVRAILGTSCFLAAKEKGEYSVSQAALLFLSVSLQRAGFLQQPATGIFQTPYRSCIYPCMPVFLKILSLDRQDSIGFKII